MLPKTLYESKPLVYGFGGIIIAGLVDSSLAWAAASLLWMASMVILYKRYKSRED